MSSPIVEAEAARRTAAEARAYAEAQMRSTCRIHKPGTGGTTTDPETGVVEELLGELAYHGRCKVKPASSWGRTAEAGGEQVAPSSFVIAVPYSVHDVERGYTVVIETSPDGWLMGRKFEIRFAPEAGDNISARRLICEEAS